MTFIFPFFQAWLVMLLLGAIHHSLWSAVPATGYLVTCIIVILANMFHTEVKVDRK